MHAMYVCLSFFPSARRNLQAESRSLNIRKVPSHQSAEPQNESKKALMYTYNNKNEGADSYPAAGPGILERCLQVRT